MGWLLGGYNYRRLIVMYNMRVSCSFLWRFDERIELLSYLKEKGFYVRMHAYEYLVGYGGKLLGIIFLDTINCRVEVFAVPGVEERMLRRLVEMLSSKYPDVGVEVYGLSV